MSKQIYFDHAATTSVLPEVREAMQPYLTEKYGNMSTAYELGEEARSAVSHAREVIAHCIDARPEEIFFTSGGSESDNWAIKSIAGEYKSEGKHIITSAIEHHAVLNSCAYLEQLGYEVTYLEVDEKGLVSMEELEQAITPETTLITVMYGNNEIGTIEPVHEIGRIARYRKIPFHTDAVQAVGQIPISVRREPIDLMSASAHKFHGPKGVGFLYVHEGVKIPSFIHGGAQEKGKRAGTENVPGIVGMAEALRIAVLQMKRNRAREIRLRNYFMDRLLREFEQVRINGHPYQRLPGNINISFGGVDATSLLTLLQEDGICASAGSACSTGQTRISHVIEAIRVPDEYAVGTIRFTLGRENTRQEVDQTIRSLKKNLTILREDEAI
ncbi:cysteine desulfurase [Roseburia sp. MUC/MUC-530-WT-4D]|uniref:cysteine desulfurase n=1 Tax=Roseburia porci TaxID=2605790 RepID=A0A6L5YPR9_9FIRM|nr:cysteine desulfurase family protein [Roseburia porci]MST74390.1 cysteine desulfurase [Roseburia porci]